MKDLQRSVVYVLQMKDLAENNRINFNSEDAGTPSFPNIFAPHSQIFSLCTLRLPITEASGFGTALNTLFLLLFSVPKTAL